MDKRTYVEDLISIIIPVYRCERHITQCIESVLQQTYQQYEIVLVDDCSPDGSAEIILQLAKEHPQIKYYKLQQNSGAAVARNTALQKAVGRYVAFLDSDDLWVDDKLECQMNLMREKQTFFVYGAIEMIDENNQIIKKRRKIPSYMTYSRLMKNTAIATSTVLIDRNIAGDFQMPLRRSGQDYATWMMLLRGSERAYGVEKVVTRYRKTENSLSSRKTKNWKDVYEVQVQQEGVSSFKAYIHCFCYALHAVKKYFF